ncbi:MAG TPA: ATP-binding protein [Anaerolinea sp.]|nr:ATP-binding protein [Anaerolinea sp.]
MEQLAAAFEKSTGTAVVCQLQTGTLAFLPEISAQLVRIVQEALNNVRKHAHAGQMTINLREWGSDLLVEIIDDGQGFDPEDIPPVAQYGLRGMRERAELIGADFQIISQPRRGTTVRLALPISFEEPSQ